ncbi:unnamed protein product [Polarella glacialis]|uniref:Alpha-ketoglutarate-dependent dioxygenase FTO n=1 Tax=Polarella glacialis TaxID=89957 RepID=A0A813I311_POLGL|nr:unnamed protein product [Polarella glacialis]
MSLSLQLVPLQAGLGGPWLLPPVGSAPLTIGRKTSCELLMPEAHAYVSGEHCRVRSVVQESKFCVDLEDLSGNGTYVNGGKVGKGNHRNVCTGDEISLAKPSRRGGAIMFRLEVVSAAVSAAVPAAVPAAPPVAHPVVPAVSATKQATPLEGRSASGDLAAALAVSARQRQGENHRLQALFEAEKVRCASLQAELLEERRQLAEERRRRQESQAAKVLVHAQAAASRAGSSDALLKDNARKQGDCEELRESLRRISAEHAPLERAQLSAEEAAKRESRECVRLRAELQEELRCAERAALEKDQLKRQAEEAIGRQLELEAEVRREAAFNASLEEQCAAMCKAELSLAPSSRMGQVSGCNCFDQEALRAQPPKFRLVSKWCQFHRPKFRRSDQQQQDTMVMQLMPLWNKKHRLYESLGFPSGHLLSAAMDMDRFVREPADASSESFHEEFRRCLHGLYEQGIFQYDLIQPVGPGTPVVSTRVTRCLIGEPGITYKYLGLRMFAHPWKGEKTSESCSAMYQHNQELISKAEEQAVAVGCDAPPYSSCFNLTLINRMDPADSGAPNKLGAVSVSWHADSSLVDYSTITVYVAEHDATQDSFGLSPARPCKPCDDPWRVALRHTPNVQGPEKSCPWEVAAQETAKPVKRRAKAKVHTVPIHDGDIYHLIGDFNHHNQHAVLAGRDAVLAVRRGMPVLGGSGTIRYSSTHRVALTEGHSYRSVKQRCSTALSVALADMIPAAAQVHEEQQCSLELEFEWIRQFFIQGKAHREALPWWHSKMDELVFLWRQFEVLTAQRLTLLRRAAAGKVGTSELDPFCLALKNGLQKRAELREAWRQREHDPLLKKQPANRQPLQCLFDAPSDAPHGAGSEALPHNVWPLVEEISQIQLQLHETKKVGKPWYQFVLNVYQGCAFQGGEVTLV